jgi:hypothetical protein
MCVRGCLVFRLLGFFRSLHVPPPTPVVDPSGEQGSPWNCSFLIAGVCVCVCVCVCAATHRKYWGVDEMVS